MVEETKEIIEKAVGGKIQAIKLKAEPPSEGDGKTVSYISFFLLIHVGLTAAFKELLSIYYCLLFVAFYV